MRDCAEYALGMTIPLERAIEAEEATETTELSEACTNGVRDG